MNTYVLEKLGRRGETTAADASRIDRAISRFFFFYRSFPRRPMTEVRRQRPSQSGCSPTAIAGPPPHATRRRPLCCAIGREATAADSMERLLIHLRGGRRPAPT